jgi:glycosyltransferase involved in cell wall biosynthesis
MISVVVPVYNSENFLKNAISSIIIQNAVSEILLIEDGSYDNSFEVCLELKRLDSRVQVLTHNGRVNRGAAESRNLGIKHAKFPYIAFLDSDDLYFENRFEESLKILMSNPSIMGCYGKVLVNYSNLDCQKLMGVPVGLNPKNLFGHILNGGYFHTNSLMVRKSFLEKVGGFDQSCWPHEDVELWTRLAYCGTLQSISSDLPIAEYRVHGNNLSQIGNWKSRLALWSKVFKNFFFKSISMQSRFFILKQLSKSLLGRFIS